MTLTGGLAALFGLVALIIIAVSMLIMFVPKTTIREILEAPIVALHALALHIKRRLVGDD
jgi:hypothetical protein